MTAFFDITNQDHLALLPDAVAKAQDLAVIADDVEADILRTYTIRPGMGYLGSYGLTPQYLPGLLYAFDAGDATVFLRGYNSDPAACDPALLSALRRAITEVIRWRVKVWRKDPLVRSENTGEGKAKSYVDNANDPFPPSWDRWLSSFDVRPRAYGV